MPSLPSLALCNGDGRRNVLKVAKPPLKLNGADKMTESGQGREEEGAAFVRDKWEPSWGFGALMCGAPRAASSHLVARPAVNNASDDSRGEVTEESKNPTETLDSCNFSAVKMQQPEKVTSPYDRYNPAAMFNAHRQADEEPDPSLRVTWSTFITEKEDDVWDDEQDE